MDTGHSCRQNLPTIVQVLCKEGELSNNNENCRLACKILQAVLRKLQAGLKNIIEVIFSNPRTRDIFAGKINSLKSSPH